MYRYVPRRKYAPADTAVLPADVVNVSDLIAVVPLVTILAESVCKGLPKVNVPSRPFNPIIKASTDLASA